MSECTLLDIEGNELYKFNYEGTSKILYGTNAICAKLLNGEMMIVPLNGKYLVKLNEGGEQGSMLYV